MLVIIDVILTVTVVAVALAAVSELQLRIAYIGSSADGTFVGVGNLRPLGRCRLAAVSGGKGNHFGGTFLFRWPTAEKSTDFYLPGSGNQIQNLTAEE